MGLEKKYPELATFAHIFPEEEDIVWQAYRKPFTGNVDVVYIYGYTPFIDPLMAWVSGNKTRDLVILEDRVGALKKMQREGVDTLLMHPQVRLCFCFPGQKIEEFLSFVVRDLPFEKIFVLNLHQDDLRYAYIEKSLFKKAVLESALCTELLHYHRLCKNLLKNFYRLPQSFDVGRWKDCFKDVPAIV